MTNDFRIDAGIDVDAGIDADDFDEAVYSLFDAVGIPGHCYEDTVAVAYDPDGALIGALTENMGGEWSVAVDSGWHGHGIATALVRQAIADGHCGFMVAGTDDGAGWIFSLYYKLSPDEREALDVPSWADIEECA